jgi:cell division inhibitor SulA
LQALYIRGSAIRIQAGNADIGAIAKGFQCRRTGISAGGGLYQVLLLPLLRQLGQNQAKRL